MVGIGIMAGVVVGLLILVVEAELDERRERRRREEVARSTREFIARWS